MCYKVQYSETNVTHFLVNLLRIEGLYMFRGLLAHPQEALLPGLEWKSTEWSSTPTQIAAN
jgi:hypothetical protein